MRISRPEKFDARKEYRVGERAIYKGDVKPKEVCCGSCKYLEYEDISGNGVCREDGDLHGVGDCCSMYKPDIKTEERTTHDRNNR